ncbi:MAG TPA: methyltransferase domain-containing protein [Gemmatimonadales bacterium]|nr:methyltransferase domain-containing protein [Gemmatimonadales bacterium]
MIGIELLDDPCAEPAAVRAELRDIARLNLLFGGVRAVVGALEPFFAEATTESRANDWTLLDVGTGLGDIPRAVARAARRFGITLRLVGVERNRAAALAARAQADPTLAPVLADGAALPLGPGSVDVVIASQVLHHLPPALAVRWIAGLNAVARRAVVIADLRRSWIAIAGLWLASFPLGFGAVTRHDAVLSLRRGYRRHELDSMLRAAGIEPVARYRPGFRVVAAWAPMAPQR